MKGNLKIKQKLKQLAKHNEDIKNNKEEKKRIKYLNSKFFYIENSL